MMQAERSSMYALTIVEMPTTAGRGSYIHQVHVSSARIIVLASHITCISVHRKESRGRPAVVILSPEV